MSHIGRIGLHAVASSALALLVTRPTQAGPRDLSAEMLDGITAGAGTTSDRADDASLIVADQSSAALRASHEVVMGERTQERASAVNLINAVASDSVNAVNVASAIGANVIGRQLNHIFQVEHSYGRVERISLTGPNLSRSHTSSRSFAAGSSGSSTQSMRVHSLTRHSVSDTYSAGVPAYYPLQDLTITLGTPDLPAVTVPQFGFDLTTSDDVGTYGIRGSLGPFTFDPPQLVLGTVTFDGDDLLIAGGYVDLPSLDLGSASVTACFIECGGVSVDLPTIDGPRIDLPGEWRFEDANPFKDVRINAGNGIAAAGRGRISVDAAHVTLTAELSLDLPDLTTSFSFDVLGHEVSTGSFGVEIPPISASVTLVDTDIGSGYDAQFDGALCLSVQATDCGTLEHAESSYSSSVDVRASTATASSWAFEESTSTHEQYITPGAALSGAEAELIAMSEGRAQIDRASTIELGSQAQRGMQVINSINATGAIVGNALNVGSQRAAAAGSGLAQSNVFSQIKTRPRGP